MWIVGLAFIRSRESQTPEWSSNHWGQFSRAGEDRRRDSDGAETPQRLRGTFVTAYLSRGTSTREYPPK